MLRPDRNPTVVTDHRMIDDDREGRVDALRPDQKYCGDPSSFAWVLPLLG